MPKDHSTASAVRRTTKNQQPKGKGDEVTPERLRDFLAHPDVSKAAKREAETLVNDLYGAGEWDTLPDTPDYHALMLEATHINGHLTNGTADDAEREIYGKLAALVNRREPRDARTVRRLSEVLADTDAETRHRVGSLMCDLHNEAGLDDLHPDLFPTLAAVYFREARKLLKAPQGKASKSLLRGYLRELEEIAKGGAR